MNLSNHWLEQGHEVDFVVLTPEGGFREELKAGVNIINLGESCGKMPARIVFIRAFAAYLKGRSPDQVFATLTYVTITALWASKLSGYQGRLIVRQANSLVNQSEQTFGVKLWNWFGYHLCYRWADTILVNSRNSEEEMLRLLPIVAEKVKLIHNPVAAPSISGSTSLKGRDDRSVVLYCGRFSKQKDVPTLIRAFALVCKKRDCELWLVGDGPERAVVESTVRELGLEDRVVFHGYVNNPADYYSSADLFVLPSKWEGFPNVLVEALNAGTASIATDCAGGSREILEPILPNNVVPVGDVNSLADRMTANLENLPPAHGLIENMQERFSLSVIAERYLLA